ncbi:PPOX class probable F420-dependent enzyme, Rv0121 family [Rubrobacter radiotolerans]|uniref:PPOX class probable F420-dependent enzyme, Rv0121 family n=1 Tax=Rubrobacter radiotolerans TaxID=42256 RepID=A0A023X2E3_RUBRA|nr:TIGR03668 family PPOX class F420-dependent oxidoreductase [Rubrobacter radiotolerans]AHY46165.1 PPOX class probable F420-dependent enzyme, Rv0121 family [Rubrobacter radiotolerans]MDX5893575.1 TIGR03668 family PPOX class F420-dependent oxidoreductase [Rubrobacter radiotolerans]
MSETLAFLTRSRVARLATASPGGEPYVVPVCFALAPGGEKLYVALDEKPKSVDVRRLRRVRNILRNPAVSLVADRYSESWERLAFVLVRGEAKLVETGEEEHARAVRLLRGKYRQYERMSIEDNPVISVLIRKTSSWGDLRARAGETPGGTSLEDALGGRRSVRRYLPLDVSGEAVEKVIEAARWAPSPHGTQPWRFAVVRSGTAKERLAQAMGRAWTENLAMDGQEPEVVRKRLEGSRRRLLDAPVLVIACLYEGDLDRYPDGERQGSERTMAIQSLGAAVQNMLLAAYAEGLDTGWMCAPLFAPAAVVEALGLDKDLVPHALVTLGYADGDPPKRRPRRPLEDLVVYRD